MSINTHQEPARESAKIYQFPMSLQQATQMTNIHQSESNGAVVERLPQRIVFGEAWYHQAAIDESNGITPRL